MAAETTKKARVAKRARHVAPKKGKSAKKANPSKKAPKGAKKAAGARDGSKTATILEMLKRPGGASARNFSRLRDGCHIPSAASSPEPSARRWA